MCQYIQYLNHIVRGTNWVIGITHTEQCDITSAVTKDFSVNNIFLPCLWKLVYLIMASTNFQFNLHTHLSFSDCSGFDSLCTACDGEMCASCADGYFYNTTVNSTGCDGEWV